MNSHRLTMNLCLCKNLISLSLKSPPNLYKPHFSFIPLFFSSSQPEKSKPVVAMADYLINQHGFSAETASKASTVIPHRRKPKNPDLVLAFLHESGFSKTHREKVIKHVPKILFSNLNKTIKPKIKLFLDLGFNRNDLTQIISSDPWILLQRTNNQIFHSISLLKSVVGTNTNVSKLLKLSTWFLKFDLEKTMIPNIEFLKSLGISESQISKFVFMFPRFFVHKPHSIKAFVERVDELGFNRNSKMFLYAIRTVSAMTRENWELKLQLFRSLGFSENDILFVFRRIPQVSAISEMKIAEGTKFLLSTGKHDISFIVNYPELLINSLERRLKPRLRIMEILESKNLLSEKKASFTTIYKMTDKQFCRNILMQLGNST